MGSEDAVKNTFQFVEGRYCTACFARICRSEREERGERKLSCDVKPLQICTSVANERLIRLSGFTMATATVSGVGCRGVILCKELEGLGLLPGCSKITYRSLTLPFRCQSTVTALQSSTHHEKLQAAIVVVQRACQLCLSVQSGMKQGEGQLEKVDNTPVTVADFGVQALVSLELGRLFPNIPLVGEENATQLRAEYEASGVNKESLVEGIVEALTPVVGSELDCETVLDAIDRGAVDIANAEQLCYWVLDPIDGTRGFLRGGNALYVIGLALVVDGKPVLGVMGCPNVGFHFSPDGMQMARESFQVERKFEKFQRGLIMAASLGGGCWVKPLNSSGIMIKSSVVRTNSIAESWFCISDNEVWSKTLLAQALAEGKNLRKDEMQVLKLCCGSLCKYFALALGGVSAFLLPAAPSAPLKVWDHASGVVCVTEAGGQVTDLEGRALEDVVGNGEEFFTVEGGGIFASNKALHDLLLTDIIRNRTVNDRD